MLHPTRGLPELIVSFFSKVNNVLCQLCSNSYEIFLLIIETRDDGHVNQESNFTFAALTLPTITSNLRITDVRKHASLI